MNNKKNNNIKPGNHFYKMHDPRKYYIVVILEKEKISQIMYKFYGIHKQWWHYKHESLRMFKLKFKLNFYFWNRKNKL